MISMLQKCFNRMKKKGHLIWKSLLNLLLPPLILQTILKDQEKCKAKIKPFIIYGKKSKNICKSLKKKNQQNWVHVETTSENQRKQRRKSPVLAEPRSCQQFLKVKSTVWRAESDVSVCSSQCRTRDEGGGIRAIWPQHGSED